MKSIKSITLLLTAFLPVLVSAQVHQSATPDSLPVSPVSIMKLHGQNPPTIRSFIVPAVLAAYGLVSLGNNAIRNLDYTTKAELQEDHPLFANHLDNYMQFAPMAALYGLNLAGIKGKHGFIDQTGLYILSFGIMGVSTGTVKRLADRSRPDGSNNYSFPSGHTANAFAAAEFLNREYRDVSPWIGYAGYTVATATGVLRMYNNRHWLSDVIAGAGFGIAATKIAYLVYPHLRSLLVRQHGRHYAMVPTYQQHSVGMAFSATF
jgi:hypothetical protein